MSDRRVGDRPKRRAGRADRGAADTAPRAGWAQAKWPILRFVAIFGLCMAVFYGLTVTTDVRTRRLEPYLKLNATVSAWLLRLAGENAVSQGTVVGTPRFQLEIARGCDAVEPSALFAAAVIAFPVAFRRKIPGLLVGIPVLLALNFVRIISLYYTGVRFPDAFSVAHLEVWQPLFILCTLLLWLGWAVWATRRGERTEP